MKAFVHIGAPKTGSSSIQSFLHANHQALAAQGMQVLLGHPRNGSQMNLALAALARIDRLPPSREQQMRYGAPTLAAERILADALNATLAGIAKTWTGRGVLISSEHIQPWLSDRTAVTALDDLMKSHFSEISYIFYMRNPVDLITSAYSERIKRGATMSLDEFIAGRSEKIDHHRDAALWVDTLGRERISLRLLERDFLKNGDLIDDYAACCGIDMKGLERPPRVNESLSVEAVEVLRVFNARVPQIVDVRTRNPMGAGVIRRLMKHPKAKTRIALTTGQREKVESSVRDSNERLRATFFPDRPVLFGPLSDRAANPPREESLVAAVEIAIDFFVAQRSGNFSEVKEEDRHLAKVIKPEKVGKAGKAGRGLLRRKAAAAGSVQGVGGKVGRKAGKRLAVESAE